jgi:hypothetical protein
MDDIKIRRPGWAGHITRMEEESIAKRFLPGNFTTQDSRKTKNKMDGRCPEGRVTDSRNKRLEETGWGQRRIVAPFERGQSAEGAVTPYVNGRMQDTSI